ncbi:uncharacterized protein [Temnothorax nylanderi]|uniref:uncharacterized protein n=1 Tax=Temnothorax nylanderi TaxID=102681 RepID=UPI003A87C446
MSEERESGTEIKKAIDKVKEKDRVRRGSTGSTGSTGTLEEFWKRKREDLDKSEGEDKDTAFKRSNMTARSPKAETEVGEKELRGIINELREGFRSMREELREGFKEQGREVEKIRNELRVREEKWSAEREELKKRIDDLERKLEGMRMEFKEGGQEGGKGAEGSAGLRRAEGSEESDWKERVERLERRCEMKERGERKRNIVIKGVKEEEGGIKGGIEEVMKKIGVEAKIEEIRKIDAGRREKGGMAVVRVGSEEEKARIIRNKWKLRDGGIWIEEDLTWEERRIKWRVNQIAWKARGEGKRVRIGQGKVWIEGEWWMWDEVRDVLRDSRGRCWEAGQGKEEEGKREEGQKQGE